MIYLFRVATMLMTVAMIPGVALARDHAPLGKTSASREVGHPVATRAPAGTASLAGAAPSQTAASPVTPSSAPLFGAIAPANSERRSAPLVSNTPVSGGLAGNAMAHHTPTPATIGGPVAKNDARKNLVTIGTGMRHRQ